MNMTASNNNNNNLGLIGGKTDCRAKTPREDVMFAAASERTFPPGNTAKLCNINYGVSTGIAV